MWYMQSYECYHSPSRSARGRASRSWSRAWGTKCTPHLASQIRTRKHNKRQGPRDKHHHYAVMCRHNVKTKTTMVGVENLRILGIHAKYKYCIVWSSSFRNLTAVKTRHTYNVLQFEVRMYCTPLIVFGWSVAKHEVSQTSPVLVAPHFSSFQVAQKHTQSAVGDSWFLSTTGWLPQTIIIVW